MRQKVFSFIRERPVATAVILSGIFLALTATSLYLFGYIKQHMVGEAFADFVYPDRNSWQESWKIFFQERLRGRLMHGIFVTILYKIFGYNPPVFYLIISLMTIFTSVLIMLTLEKFVKRAWLASLLTMALTLLPLNIPSMMSLWKAHHVLGWLAFWASVYFYTLWVNGTHRGDLEKSRNNCIWLVFSATSFLVSVLSYEAAIAVFPIVIPLNAARVRMKWNLPRISIPAIAIMLFSIGTYFLLEQFKLDRPSRLSFLPVGVYGYLGELVYGLFGTISAVWNIGLYGWFYAPLDLDVAINRLFLVIFLILAIVNLIMFRSSWHQKALNGKTDDINSLTLLGSGIWICLATSLPFILIGEKPTEDSLRGFAFGLIFTAISTSLFLTRVLKEQLGNILVSVFCFFWIFVGAVSYTNAISIGREIDDVVTNYVLTLKQKVPYVKENTTFIFINPSPVTYRCEMLDMLYARSHIRCIQLLDNVREASVTRKTNKLVDWYGTEFEEDFVILTMDEVGNVALVEEINPSSYPNLPIVWVSREPIRFSQERVIKSRSPLTAMYAYFLRHSEMYFPSH